VQIVIEIVIEIDKSYSTVQKIVIEVVIEIGMDQTWFF